MTIEFKSHFFLIKKSELNWVSFAKQGLFMAFSRALASLRKLVAYIRHFCFDLATAWRVAARNAARAR